MFCSGIYYTIAFMIIWMMMFGTVVAPVEKIQVPIITELNLRFEAAQPVKT